MIGLGCICLGRSGRFMISMQELSSAHWVIFLPFPIGIGAKRQGDCKAQSTKQERGFRGEPISSLTFIQFMMLYQSVISNCSIAQFQVGWFGSEPALDISKGG